MKLVINENVSFEGGAWRIAIYSMLIERFYNDDEVSNVERQKIVDAYLVLTDFCNDLGLVDKIIYSQNIETIEDINSDNLEGFIDTF